MTTDQRRPVSFRLDGRRALVTGGGGGIGGAVADGLAELGAEVIATSRDRATAQRLAVRYGTAPCVLNVMDVGSMEDTIETVCAHGPIDILVNNAGVNRPASVLDVTEQIWDEVLGTNLKGAFFLAQTVASRMIERGGGSIINIGSQAGTVGIEQRAPYCASKGGLVQVTKVLALELAEFRIRVNNVSPTFVLTDLTRETLEQPELRSRFLAKIPLGRFADTHDVVGAVAYLAGDMAAMVTGHDLLVDGGWTAS